MTYIPHDRYYKKAKQQGYRSRAAYKLLELQQRLRLLHSGDAVVDLGAAPGGWLQVAGKIVGENGKVIGVDLQSIKPFNQRNILLLAGDIAALETSENQRASGAERLDCRLAPKTGRIRDAACECWPLNCTRVRSRSYDRTPNTDKTL